MAYMESGNVKVFPSANRTADYQRDARHMSEDNITSITNKVTDNDSYVISQNMYSSPFELVLGGYYFKLTNLSGFLDLQGDFSSALNVYASIEINNTGAYRTLNGQDDEDTGLYSGISITFTQPVPENGYWLTILTRDSISDSWRVPKESMVRFIASSLPLVIDGGEI